MPFLYWSAHGGSKGYAIYDDLKGAARVRRFQWLLLVTLIGCAEQTERADRPVAEDSTSQPPAVLPPAHPDSAALQRLRQQLPPEVLVRGNACPFECCVYGEWRADTVIAMHAAPRATGTPVFSVPKGTRIKADSGVVFVTSLAFAVVADTVFRYSDKKAWLLPGDTLVLLDPIGEGYWTMWRRGEVLNEVPPFFESVPEPKRGHLVGRPQREWWVHAAVGNRSGWFHADRVRVSGADSCAGPIE
jgi:hypothetical protein